MGLVKTEMESFFQNQTKSFENHMKVKNYLNSDNQVQTRIKTEPKDVDFIEKPKELKITFYKCVLCSKRYEISQDIESHLTNVHSVSIRCQNPFIEKETITKFLLVLVTLRSHFISGLTSKYFLISMLLRNFFPWGLRT